MFPEQKLIEYGLSLKERDNECKEMNNLFNEYCINENNTKDETADWQTYRNEEYGFELQYPLEWKVDEDGKTAESNSVTSFSFQIEGVNSKGKIIVGVYTLPNKRFVEYAGVVAGTNSNYQFVVNGKGFTEDKEMSAVFNQILSSFKFIEKETN